MKVLGFLFVFVFSSLSYAQSPKLFLESGELLDMLFEMQSKTKIAQDIKDELKARTPEFQQVWDENSSSLIDISQQMCARKFSRQEYSVSLVVGPYIPMARPFIMNMRPYLAAAMAPKPAASNYAFVALLHHELLHHLLDNTEGEDFKQFSKLWQKYEALLKDSQKQDDNFVVSVENVLSHLHLMALQSAVYKKLGRPDLLEEADDTYMNAIGGAYKKAWEIVNQEGELPFLAELNQFNSQRGF